MTNTHAVPQVSIDALENATIDADTFDHESHVYAAWLYLEQWPPLEATRRFCNAIRRLTVKLGAESKYHETITCFFMQLISERRQQATGSNWLQFRANNIDIVSAAGNTLHRYYSQELLDTELARRHYLLPDKLVRPVN